MATAPPVEDLGIPNDPVEMNRFSTIKSDFTAKIQQLVFLLD